MDWLVSRSDAQSIACMLGATRPSDAELFAFDNSVFNFDVNILERGPKAVIDPKAVIEGTKAFRTTRVNPAIVDYRAKRKHLSNRFTPSLVPDFLKPTPAQVALVFGHQGPSSRFSLLQNPAGAPVDHVGLTFRSRSSSELR